MVLDLWLGLGLAREKTHCCHYMDYSFRLAARVLLHAPSQGQGSTYTGVCYTSCGVLAEIRNSPIIPPWRSDPATHHIVLREYDDKMKESHIMIIAKYSLRTHGSRSTEIMDVTEKCLYLSEPYRVVERKSF